MTRAEAQRRVVVTYLGSTVLGVLAASLIWGVHTLYLLANGLDIFLIMLEHTTFTVSQVLFEVPTGVVADTLGRKTSYLISIAILILSTMLYVVAGNLHLGFWGFVAASALLALGWSFQTGAVEAWLVDALDHTGWEGPKERVFAWGGIAAETSLVVGTVAGGFLGQADLAVPFYVRTILLAACFVFVAVMMRDQGFERRPLHLATIGSEVSLVFRTGVRYGWRQPVVRLLLLESALVGAFFMYGFYSLQPFLLEMLGRDLVWVAAVGTAAGSLAGIAGNVAVTRIMRGPNGRRRPARVLIATTALAGTGVAGAGLVGVLVPASSRGVAALFAVVALWAVLSFANGVAGPVRRAFLNEHVVASRRATVLSLDALFEEIGGSCGQPALGWVSRAYSIPAAWLMGSVMLFLGMIPLRGADRAASED